MEKLEFGPSCSASTGAERFLVALPTSGDLFICAKDLLVEAKASPHTWGRCLQAQHSRPWLVVWRRCQRCCRCSSSRCFAAMASNCLLISPQLMNAIAIMNSTVPTIHNRKSPRRQFIVQPILDPVSHDLADSTRYDKDKATPTPPIIAMLEPASGICTGR